MEEFLIYIKLLIGVLGHKLLEDVTTSSKKNDEHNTFTATTQDNQVVSMTRNLELFLSVSGLKASALQTDEGIVVLEGSEAAKDIKPSLHRGYRELREKLIKNETLVLEGNKYVFKKNTLFDTATPAAAVIVGYSITGPQTWKNKDEKSLKDIEQELLKKQNSSH